MHSGNEQEENVKLVGEGKMDHLNDCQLLQRSERGMAGLIKQRFGIEKVLL